MIDIEQDILKKKNLYIFIEKSLHIIYNRKKFDFSIFFPKKKEWFVYYKKIFKNILKDKENIKSLVYYKSDGSIDINKLLINKSLPYVFLFNKYGNLAKDIYQKTFINTDPIYIFPDDLKKISDYNKNNLLNHIKNLDYLFVKNYNDIILSDCIVFRGMNDNELIMNKSKINFNNIFNKMILQQSLVNIKKLAFDKNNEFIFDNYVSTTFNMNTALNFNGNIFLIINIKKEHNVPGFFISDLFFRNINNQKNLNNFLKINEYEFEILIHRNFKIKIKEIKIIEIENKYYFKSSINNLYSKKDKKNDTKKIKKLIFAESCPFEIPEDFVVQNDFKYICTKVNNNY
jgi:hypothetical protein